MLYLLIKNYIYEIILQHVIIQKYVIFLILHVQFKNITLMK